MIEELEQTDNLKNELSHLKSLLNAGQRISPVGKLSFKRIA